MNKRFLVFLFCFFWNLFIEVSAKEDIKSQGSVKVSPDQEKAISTRRETAQARSPELQRTKQEEKASFTQTGKDRPDTSDRVLREKTERKKRNDALFNAEMERLKKRNARIYGVSETDGQPSATRIEKDVQEFRDSPLDRSPALKRIRQAEKQRARLQREAFGSDADYERIRAQTEAAKRKREKQQDSNFRKKD